MYTAADVSVCIPFWASRPVDALAIAATVTAFKALGCEVSVCDDGSTVRPKFPVIPDRICARAVKAYALNPCKPLNRAVRNSTRPVVLLTNPGMRPATGLLEAMLPALWEDRNLYVAAACKDQDTGRWLVHSTVKGGEYGRGPMPAGSGFHHCAAMNRGLFERAGGFDEDYREGQAYDDNDFLWRLEAAGARFRILDDIVLDHCPSSTAWPAGGLSRNKALFESKWSQRH